MNSITATYPGFQGLPKGVKKMLVVSESLFFEEASAGPHLHTSRLPNGVKSPTHEDRSDAASPTTKLPEVKGIEPWMLAASRITSFGRL